MKKLIILFLLISNQLFSQQHIASVGAGFGFSNKSNLFQLTTNINTNLVGFDFSATFELKEPIPTYFSMQIYKSLYINDRLKISPMGGIAYKWVSDNPKDSLSYFTGVFGFEIVKRWGKYGLIYLRNSYLDKGIQVLIGIRGIIGSNQNCN